MNSLNGKVAIVTGASQGLGLAIARKYVQAGVKYLAICARDGPLLERAKVELETPCGKTCPRIVARTADVSKAEDVRLLVETTVADAGQVDILVNNAGVYGPKGNIEDIDWQEWMRAIEINLYGSILMCRAVLPYFRAQGHGKIIQISGGGATNPLPRISAYAASKVAIVRFIETLAEEVRGTGVQANTIAPGALNTRLLTEILEAGPEKVGKAFYEQAIKQKQNGGVSPDKAAELAVYLASNMSDGITGKLISAVWDPWSTLAEHQADLDMSDIYTLRRIVPGDRGKAWGND